MSPKTAPMRHRKRWDPFLLPVVCLLAALLGAAAWLVPRRALGAQNVPPGELSSHESAPAFKLQVERNVVLVRAVVRDGKGQPVKGLTKDDFRIYDNGKLQTITQFSVETPASAVAPAAPAAQHGAEAKPESAPSAKMPRRFLALYFDDVHTPLEDIPRVREAAEKYLNTAMRIGDRVGIFTSSGQGDLDFTSDRSRLDAALLRLQARPTRGGEARECPPLLDYQAYLMIHNQDPYAIDLATQQTMDCMRLQVNATGAPAAQSSQAGAAAAAAAQKQAAMLAQAAAVSRLNRVETESEGVLREIDRLMMRMAVLPGQRNIVLISPGFMTLLLRSRLSDLVDRALRSKIIINTVDARGLYAPPPLDDASKTTIALPERPDLMGQMQSMRIRQFQVFAEPLTDLAADTGGVYFHNSNDLLQGLQEAGNLPEVYYLLAFSPHPLKFNGRLHTLKVKLVPSRHLEVEARRGYYAPSGTQSAEARAQQEIREAVFSQDDLRGIPIEVHTQFFKRNEMNADLAVLTRVDLRFVAFQKQNGLNVNRLTVVTVLFDQDGNYVAGKEKKLSFHMRDSTLAALSRTGLALRTRFNVKPGTYMVRDVVQDADGSHISGLTRTVEIPY